MKNKKLGKYYQPEIDDNGDVKGHPGKYIPSFMVWRKKSNLMQDYPHCTPLEYKNEEIEEPTFAD